MEALSEESPVLLEQDHYYKDLSHLSVEDRARYNFDHPDAIDFGLMAEHLRSLASGAAVDRPTYDFGQHLRQPHTVRLQPSPVVIVEGTLIFGRQELSGLLDMKIYLDTDADIRFIRRLRRDLRERGRTVQSVVEQYLTTVYPMHKQFIEPAKSKADVIVSSDRDKDLETLFHKVLAAVPRDTGAAAGGSTAAMPRKSENAGTGQSDEPKASFTEFSHPLSNAGHTESSDSLRKVAMKKHPYSKFVLAILAVTLFAGCSRDPNVRKQKYLASGKRYFEKKDYRAASIQFQNAIQIDPKYSDAHYQLALTDLQLRDWRGGYGELMRTIDLAPDNAQAQIVLGNLLLAARQFDQAQQHADLVLQKDPKNVDAHMLRAVALSQQQQTDASLKEMQTAIDLDPARAPSYLNMGALEINAKDAAAAEESFKKAVEVDPKSIQARLALGTFYARQRRWSDAETEFRKAVEIDPKNVGPRIVLCRLLLASNQIPQAEEAAKETKETLKDSPAAYRLLADVYFQVGDLGKALDEYASVSKAHPKDLQVKKAYVELLILQGRLDEADKINGEILKTNPLDQQSLLAHDQILVQQGHAAQALDQLQAAVKNDPNNVLAHYYLGVAFNATGDSGQAEAQWREAVRLNPRFIQAQTALAAVALNKRDPAEVTSAAEAIISARPNAPDGYVLRAVAKDAKHDQAGAESDLNKAMEVAPKDPSGFAAMGQLRLSQKRFADAEKLYDQALALNPNYTQALQGLVTVFLVQKQPEKALAKVTEMIGKAPENGGYYVLQSSLLLNSKPPDFDKAEAALLKASDLNKADAGPLMLLAQLYTSRGAGDKAAATADAAIQHNPKDPRAYFLAGEIQDSQGNWQKAQDFYKKTLEVQPDFAMASNNLAFVMLEHSGNSDVALSLAQTARQKLPDNPSVADTLAWAYYKKGAYGLAIDLLEEASKKLPNDPSIHYHLGLAYQKTADKTKARAHLERALQLNPAFQHAGDVKSALAELRPA